MRRRLALEHLWNFCNVLGIASKGALSYPSVCRGAKTWRERDRKTEKETYRERETEREKEREKERHRERDRKRKKGRQRERSRESERGREKRDTELEREMLAGRKAWQRSGWDVVGTSF